MKAVDLGPVPERERTQPAFDLFLIFAGANIVATTMVTGASLAPGFGPGQAHLLIALGSVLGAALVAMLVPVGPRLGVPSVIAARAALGRRGATALALLLYLTNFAWIALNNVIAASACARVAGGPASERAWAFGLGIAATVIVALGPHAAGLADRVAVPLMLGVGALLTLSALRGLDAVASQPPAGGAAWARGLDLVVGYQISWILMFADYSRYTRSAARGALAVFLALALTSLWFMSIGYLGARAAGSADPGAMAAALGLGSAGAVLLALGTLTTNFVNIYLSALAFKSLIPSAGEQLSVWSIGLVGAGLSLLSRAWLEGYADFMLLLGGALVPVGGVLVCRFFLSGEPVDAARLYDAGRPGEARAGGIAWLLGATAYYAASSLGGTLPALLVAAGAYALLAPRLRARPA